MCTSCFLLTVTCTADSYTTYSPSHSPRLGRESVQRAGAAAMAALRNEAAARLGVLGREFATEEESNANYDPDPYPDPWANPGWKKRFQDRAWAEGTMPLH